MGVHIVQKGAQKESGLADRLEPGSLGSYFGGWVVAPPELFLPFLLFLPPFLLCDLVLPFLPLSVLGVSVLLPLEPPVPCANDKLAASNIVKANVSIFFI